MAPAIQRIQLVLTTQTWIFTSELVLCMTTPQQYDAIVIGAGQGGGPLSRALAGAGMRTAIIERTHVGGTCVNEGCTPTKTMVASGRVAYLARRAADYGVHTGPISIDLQKVRERKRNIVDSFRNAGQSGLEKTRPSRIDFRRGAFQRPEDGRRPQARWQ